MNEESVPSRSLTIYLIKSGRGPESIIRPEAPIKARHKITLGGGHSGELYIRWAPSRVPKWAGLFEGYIEGAELGQVSSPGAVLLLEIKDRVFAVTFGQGRYLLEQDSWEERFGLRVTLNSIGENQIRSIDKHTFDALTRHTREQTSRDARVQDFGFDVEQDLLKAVTGKPKEEIDGLRLSGRDALVAVVKVRLTELPELLSHYYDKYLDTTYKQKFPWVDQLVDVSDSRLKQQLDEQLIKLICSKNQVSCWLAVPEIIDWSRVSGFRYSNSKREPERYDIHLSTFLGCLNDASSCSIKTLKQRKVFCIGEDDSLLAQWSVYRCVNCELDHQGELFLLSNAKWYRIDRDFVTRINEAFDAIPRSDIDLPLYADDSEQAYNCRICKENPGKFTLMDRKNISYGDGYSKIEFCDLYGGEGEIIHVKRYGGSSSLSHLFAQGVVSGEVFQASGEFRGLVDKHLPPKFKLEDPEKRPSVGQYRVTFAVISRSSGNLTLPFFSKLNLRHAVRRLEAFGYRVALSKISVSEEVSKLQRYPSQ